jgi:hypothetical protein
MLDELAAEKPSTFEWLLHTDGAVTKNEKLGCWEAKIGTAKLRIFPVLPAGAAVQVEPQTLRVSGRDETVNVVKISNPTPATAVEFLTVLFPMREGDTSTVVGVESARNEGTLSVTVRFPWGPWHPLLFRAGPDGYTFAAR